MTDITVTQDFNSYELPVLGFYREVIKRGLLHTRAGNIETTAKMDEMSDLWVDAQETRINLGDDNSRYVWFVHDECLVYMIFSEQSVYTTVASNDYARAERVYKVISEKIPEVAAPPKDETYIYFWSNGSNGPMNVRRRIAVPSWTEIDGNYTSKVNGELERLMKGHASELLTDGQLILWQGPPGTGKTYALRALAREWREWCDFHFITDPDAFFGSAAYMMQVVLKPNHYVNLVDDGEEKWNLLILEDSGELLAADAKQQVGQSLSRLLNLVDGMIGQGLRIIVLVTTNEELSKLHDAVSRHGRTASRISFEELSKDEAAQWLERHNLDQSANGHRSIADLYALSKGIKDSKESTSFGFTG